MSILDPNQSYTFRQFFDLQIPPSILAEEFGYHFCKAFIDLPRWEGDVTYLSHTLKDINLTLPRLVSSNEQIKREAMIFPVVRGVMWQTQANLWVEHPIKVSAQLQGIVDYVLQSDQKRPFIVIEAKKDDLDFGFTQLEAELFAMDQGGWNSGYNQQEIILGAVSIGRLWQLGVLDRPSKTITQGLNTYRVPEDLDELMRILIQALMF
jgi:hypothetical protein